MSMKADIRTALERIQEIVPKLSNEQVEKIEEALQDLWLNGHTFDSDLENDYP